MRGATQRKAFRSLHVSSFLRYSYGLSRTGHRIYLFISTVFFAYNGFPLLGEALGLADVSVLSINRFSECNETRQKLWDHHTPEFVFITEYALASVIGFAILVMFGT